MHQTNTKNGVPKQKNQTKNQELITLPYATTFCFSFSTTDRINTIVRINANSV